MKLLFNQSLINLLEINECELANQPCDQKCTNKNEGYECSCYPGYKLASDKTSCIRKFNPGSILFLFFIY